MVDSVKIKSPPHDPIAAALSSGDDRLVLSHWLPPQTGIAAYSRRQPLVQPSMDDTNQRGGPGDYHRGCTKSA